MEQIKMAIIGAGTWGATHAAIYSEYPVVKLAGVCDVNREKALRLAARYGIPEEHVYTDHREMIRRCPFDAAAVVTPDFLHRDFAVDCAAAGKHLPPNPATRTAAPGGGTGQVWVNEETKVYHCQGDEWYGKTKKGQYMTEAAATAAGDHPAHGKACVAH